MSRSLRLNLGDDAPRDESLFAEFRGLWADAEQIWESRENQPAFATYVSADYEAVYRSLAALHGRVRHVLEWGSGLGVVTIMAARMGFEAYGIEAEQALVQLAEQLAIKYRANATFACGSFIPDEYEWKPSYDDSFQGTAIDSASAYDELDLELRDFELVYAYPWPTEHAMYHDIMQRFGARNSLLLSYDAREGIALTRFRCR